MYGAAKIRPINCQFFDTKFWVCHQPSQNYQNLSPPKKLFDIQNWIMIYSLQSRNELWMTKKCSSQLSFGTPHWWSWFGSVRQKAQRSWIYWSNQHELVKNFWFGLLLSQQHCSVMLWQHHCYHETWALARNWEEGHFLRADTTYRCGEILLISMRLTISHQLEQITSWRTVFYCFLLRLYSS